MLGHIHSIYCEPNSGRYWGLPRPEFGWRGGLSCCPSRRLWIWSNAAQINSVFDDIDDFLSAEIEAITDHPYLGRILELNLEYTNGDMSGHPITVVTFISCHWHQWSYHYCDGWRPIRHCQLNIDNGLKPVSNGIHGHCVRKFLKVPVPYYAQTVRRCDFNGFDATLFQPSPRNVAFSSLSIWL